MATVSSSPEQNLDSCTYFTVFHLIGCFKRAFSRAWRTNPYIASKPVRAHCAPMAYSYSYDVTRKIIQVVQSGIANYYKETLDWMMAVRTDTRFGREYGILCDFREGTLQITSADAFTCGTIISYFFPKQKIAYVIPDGLTPMVEKQVLAVQQAAELRSFSGVQDAEDWLCATPC